MKSLRTFFFCALSFLTGLMAAGTVYSPNYEKKNEQEDALQTVSQQIKMLHKQNDMLSDKLDMLESAPCQISSSDEDLTQLMAKQIGSLSQKLDQIVQTKEFNAKTLDAQLEEQLEQSAQLQTLDGEIRQVYALCKSLVTEAEPAPNNK